MNISVIYPKRAYYLSSSTTLPILVDGKIAGTVMVGKTLTIPLHQPTVILSVRGDKKSALTVKNGGEIEIHPNKIYFSLYYSSLLAVILVSLLTLPTIYELTILIAAIGTVLFGHLLFPRFNLIKRKSSD